MKLLLTTLLVFVFINVYGQKDSSKVKLMTGGEWRFGGTVSGYSTERTISANLWVTKDTIPVLLLVCDTAEYKYLKLPNYAMWSYGYQVLSPVYHHFDHITTKQHVSYLDRNKQPLRKSIVVWMVKPLN